MSKEDKGILVCGIIVFFCILVMVTLPSCGYVDYGDDHKHNVIVEGESTKGPTNEKLSKKDVEKSCFSSSCHNRSAPTIPLIGEGFKDSEAVRKAVVGKRMPPAGWSDKKIKMFVEYLDSE